MILATAVTVVVMICVAIVIGYTALLIFSLPSTDISDTLRPYERTKDGVTGWDINEIGGFPVLMDGFNPTWINRTVRKSGAISDLTIRFDDTCSDSMNEEVGRRGISIADSKPRPVPCEGDASKPCVRIPFHIHLHGSYVERRHAKDGTTFAYRGLFHMDMFTNMVSVLAKKNPLFVGGMKLHVDPDTTEGEPPVLDFPAPPALPTTTARLGRAVGMCVDPSYLPAWHVEDRRYKFPEGMRRPFNMLLHSTLSASSYQFIESAVDKQHMDAMADAINSRNAAGAVSSHTEEMWNRRDVEETHIPSASAVSFLQCLHFNGDHPEARAHAQRCVKLDQNEVVVAEEVGELGQRQWLVKNVTAYNQVCAENNQGDDVDDCLDKEASDWGHPCGYVVVPLEQELLTFGGNTQFDPEGPQGRNIEVTVGRTMLKFEGTQLVSFTENTQYFVLHEKPSPDGPPAYAGTMQVAPVTWGGPAPSSQDGRGEVPGLAVQGYNYTRSKFRMRALHIMYFNLYKGKALFFSGCGMPEAEYLWSDEENCPHTEETRRAYIVLREALRGRASTAIDREAKFTDTFASSYAFVQTLGCGAGFIRSNRKFAHGIDWLETVVWGHQIAEYSLDLDVDSLVHRRYWNNLQPVNDQCVPNARY